MQRAKVGGTCKDDGPHSGSRESILMQNSEFEMELKNGEQPSEILEQGIINYEKLRYIKSTPSLYVPIYVCMYVCFVGCCSAANSLHLSNMK